MRKRLLAIIAALALSACLPAGCGGDNKDGSSSDAAMDTAAQAVTEAQSGSGSSDSQSGTSSQSQSSTSEPDPQPASPASSEYELPVIRK